MTQTPVRPLATRAPLGDRPAIAPATDRLDLEVVVPAYNEELRVAQTVRELRAVLGALDGLRTQVTVVDNGSSDRTAEQVDALDREPGPPVRVLGCATVGKGAAVRRGMLASRAEVMGFVDADSSTPASAIPAALEHLARGSDVVVGSRRCEGAEYVIAQGRVRRAGSWAFRAGTRSLGLGVSDTQCGFKFFRRPAALALFEVSVVAGFCFDIELLVHARDQGLTVTEMPVRWTDSSDSTLHPVRHALDVVREIRAVRQIDAGR